MSRVAIVGTGYVGLVTGTCFAELGNQVVCVDINEQKIAAMQAGTVPIYEPGLEELFRKTIAADRLHFTTDLAAAVRDAEVIFLALPTPPGEDGSADLSYVLGVAEQLGPLLQDYAVIVDKSTVPVGTAEQVRAKVAQGAQVPFDVVSNPEFLREGYALQDFMHPDRVVLGTTSTRAQEIMTALYAPLASGDQLMIMDEHSAELTKYAANSFLALKISFINEIANLCELLGADVEAVSRGIGADERIGRRFLQAGIGYGGSCFPKDVLALLHTASQYGYDFRMLQHVIAFNSEQQRALTKKVLRYYDQAVAGKTFALWGIAFKPDTDDIRQAPALDIIRDLIAAGATVRVYDPEAMPNARQALADVAGVVFADDPLSAAKDADALIIATEWPVFKAIDFGLLRDNLAVPVVFDGRNIFDTAAMQAAGFYYESMGRATVTLDA